ncbi:MAG: hypothetical protein HA491_04190 [Candidatus Verstraetearchaeota archaeon]|nr:hypothetical protein [Candidatus Verstraetearchaeota archaeon]
MPWGWVGPWPGRGPFSYLPPWLRPCWIFGRGACWWFFAPYAWYAWTSPWPWYARYWAPWYWTYPWPW